MKPEPRAREGRPSVVPLAAMAAAAVVIGHQVVYVLAIPSSAERASLLARTGHAYLPEATHLAVLGALATAGGLFLRSMTGGGSESARGSLFRALALVQAGMFVGMEIAERLAAGAPVAEVFSHGILVLGIAMELILAFGATVLIGLLHRAGEAAASLETGSPLRLRPESVVRDPSPRFVPLEIHRGVAAPRAPPSA